MYPDQTYRAFLLKMVDADTDAAIEEGILDGSIDSAHLNQIEDELIDDSLYGRLSDAETIHFTADFICTPERKAKLAFARAMKQYSSQQSSPIQRVPVWNNRKRFAAIPWNLPLAGALASVLLVTGWLTERNLSLRSDLAVASRKEDEYQRIIASLRREQAGMHPHIATPSQSAHDMAGPESGRSPGNTTDQISKPGDDLEELPFIQLSSGVNRGLAAVRVLQIGRKAKTVQIRLDLAFALAGAVHEELLDSAGKSIWSQQFSASHSIAPQGITTIILPVALFTSGEYRLRVQAGTSGEESAPRVEYLFRVSRN
jgi:hypothetical protein